MGDIFIILLNTLLKKHDSNSSEAADVKNSVVFYSLEFTAPVPTVWFCLAVFLLPFINLFHLLPGIVRQHYCGIKHPAAAFKGSAAIVFIGNILYTFKSERVMIVFGRDKVTVLGKQSAVKAVVNSNAQHFMRISDIDDDQTLILWKQSAGIKSVFKKIPQYSNKVVIRYIHNSRELYIASEGESLRLSGRFVIAYYGVDNSICTNGGYGIFRYVIYIFHKIFLYLFRLLIAKPAQRYELLPEVMAQLTL